MGVRNRPLHKLEATIVISSSSCIFALINSTPIPCHRQCLLQLNTKVLTLSNSLTHQPPKSKISIFFPCQTYFAEALPLHGLNILWILKDLANSSPQVYSSGFANLLESGFMFFIELLLIGFICILFLDYYLLLCSLISVVNFWISIVF